KFSADGTGPEGARRASFDFPPTNKERAFRVVDVMREIARERGTTVRRIALAWLLHRPFVTSVIIGAKDQAQLDDNLGAVELSLSDEEQKRLDEVSALPTEYPGWMIERMSGERGPR